MIMKRYLLAGAAALALVGVGLAVAQQLTSRTLTGSEVVLLQAGIGGTSFYAATSQMRNSQGVQSTALTTGTLTLVNQSPATLISTAASSALAIQLPPIPWDGEIFEWVNGSGAAFTGATIATTDGSTIVNGATGVALATLAAGASVEYRYLLATNAWYKLR